MFGFVFQSRNGTYITLANETKHYTNMITEEPLEQNDMISFGFNTASVYDVNDKNAFIYRLVKEQIETIDIDDSEDEEAPSSKLNATTKDKFIEIANKVIDIDSDSDSNYSGDECLQNIEEMEEENTSNSSIIIDGDESYSDDYSESDESLGSEEENFMITKTILKCGTPTETIALDEDDDEVPDAVESIQPEQGDDNADNCTIEVPSTSGKSKDKQKSTESDAKITENEAKSTVEDIQSTENVTKSVEKDTPSIGVNQKADEAQQTDDQKSETAQKSTPESDNQAEARTSKSAQSATSSERLEKLRQSIVQKTQKKIALTNAQPVRKRRQTITEDEYNKRKQQKAKDIAKQKQLRREKLAEIAQNNKEKVEYEEAAKLATNLNRVQAVPKVKITTVTRSEQLCTDMLASDKKNT